MFLERASNDSTRLAFISQRGDFKTKKSVTLDRIGVFYNSAAHLDNLIPPNGQKTWQKTWLTVYQVQFFHQTACLLTQTTKLS